MKKMWDRIISVLKSSFAFGLLFSGAMVCGAQLERSGNVDFADWKLWVLVVVLALAVAPVIGGSMCLLDRLGDKKGEERQIGEAKRLSDRTYFFLVTGILCCSYLVTMLAVWPGFFSYDAETTVYMVFTQKYSAICPRIHVILLGWCLRLVHALTGSYNLGIAAYLFAQILILSASFSYMMTFLYRIGVNVVLRRIGIAFLALFPTVSMFVCCTTKDSMFSGGVVLLTTLLLELAHDEETFRHRRSRKILFVLASLQICLFRNNGIYAYISFIPFFFFYYRRKWKYYFWPVGITLAAFAAGTMLMNRVFEFKDAPVAEMCCVPMQQLARVYTERKAELSPAEQEVLYDLIPEAILDRYTPKLADSVKVNFLGDNFKKEPWRYISLWLHLGLRYPGIYVNSFLENTYGYWYPFTILDGYRGVWIVSRQYGDSSYFQFVTEPPGERHSLIPWLERFYEKISLEIYQQKIPVISLLFSIGFWHWIYLFLGFYLVLFRSREQAMALAPTGFLYLTVLLGPIALVRYALYLFFCAPLAIALLFQRQAFEA